jgi:hypothetical protein
MGEHAYFEAGTANTARNEYANFNGQLTGIRLAFHLGSYIDDINVLRGYVSENFPAPPRMEFEPTSVDVSEEGKIESSRDDNTPAPVEYPEEYMYPREYSVSLWFRYLRTDPVPW